MAHLQRFMYTEEDRNRILSNIPKLLEEQDSDLLMQCDDLLEALKKRVRITLHASTLGQYCDKAQIPRGLRIQKGPTLFSDKEEFRMKWMAILNKCSYDLMLLVIEESSKEISEIGKEIENMETKIKSVNIEAAALNKKLEEIDNKVKNFEKQLKEIKIKKIQRDNRDYLENRVYKWLEKPYRGQPKKKVSWSDNRSEYETTASEDSANSSADEGPSYNFRQNRSRQYFDQPFFVKRRGRGRKKT